MINRRWIIHVCPCSARFNGPRNAKYCGDECRAKAKKQGNAAYERRVKRPPHLYRKKKTIFSENQLDLFCTDAYEEAS